MRYEFRDKFSVFSFRFAAFSKRPHAIFALSELSSAQTRPPPFIDREQRAASCQWANPSSDNCDVREAATPAVPASAARSGLLFILTLFSNRDAGGAVGGLCCGLLPQ